MSKILVTGMSGTGKSSALAELGRRGYRVVDTDEPGWREYREYVEFSDEVHRGEWLWVEERITGLLDSDDGRSLFVQGCVRNQGKFYARFHAVVLLSAPADVILDRVARRTTNEYGKTPVERAMILDDPGPTGGVSSRRLQIVARRALGPRRRRSGDHRPAGPRRHAARVDGYRRLHRGTVPR